MVINDLMDLIKKLFGDDYESIVIIDSSNRQRHEAERLTVKELKMDIEEKLCRYPEYFTKQGKYIWENGLEGQVEDIMEKIPCSREMAIEYVYLMNRAFNGID